MLVELFPRVHERYTSLPVLGPTMESFAGFLVERGYPVGPVRRHIRTVREVDARLRRRGTCSIAGLTRASLRACGPPPGRAQDDASVASTIRLLEAHLKETGLLGVAPPVSTPAAAKLADYRQHLEQVRGLAAHTIHEHVVTAGGFLAHICADQGLKRLSKLRVAHVEEFVKLSGQRLSRQSLQHTVAHLRSFLRFLAMHGETPGGLDSQIDLSGVATMRCFCSSRPMGSARARSSG